MERTSYNNDILGSICSAIVLVASIFLSDESASALGLTGALVLLPAPILWILAFREFKKYGGALSGKPYFDVVHLVTSGVFSVVRHPQYVAYILITSGFSMRLNRPVFYLLAMAVAWFFYRQTVAEDRLLANRFPDEFQSFSGRMPRFNFISGLAARLSRNDKPGDQ